ncbi:osmoprotectant transport system substrate-binding protein [Paramicrobacterium agarici]|uniref:Osmoprotectant transport system substrate-binding protein n=2 Tax=Paramicrobacterium agarici TaxID=630514 RepID=A0A2A9DU62_9MICO|nr:osmoprotectant transport system substrate-binding protein [Microbacterium agarici]TQO23342.1 osmoprotectant transport system substrate-binding protein [Microbacterium agarici]
MNHHTKGTTMLTARRTVGLAAALTAALALSACGSADTISGSGDESGGAESTTITVGSAGFAESEIIAEIYAQALEAQGVTVERTMQIGQRDVYISALEDGSIDLIPDYSGNLLQYYNSEADASSSDEVYEALTEAVPDGFEVLDQSSAEDKDSYNVTKEFSEKHGVTSLADLADVDEKLVIGGNPELKERPYGPTGLTDVYGVPAANMSFKPINDSGGPLTVEALRDGTVNVADLFTTSPAIAENGFVTLDDPENLILPQNVLPLINSDAATDEVAETLNAVSAELTTEALIEMNARNQGEEKASPATIAKDWLAETGLV